MGELKSAWEIAQERAARLGKLSPEEEEEQERQRCREIGQALAQKWLGSSQELDLTAELAKHEQKEEAVIKQALIEHLVRAIELTAPQGVSTSKRIIEVISSLQPELQSRATEISQLIQEYELAEQRIRQELESKGRETLHQLRISGTAVGAINIEAAQEWQLARQELMESLTPQLDKLKRTLTSSP
jgi:hypothetical protein